MLRRRVAKRVQPHTAAVNFSQLSAEELEEFMARLRQKTNRERTLGAGAAADVENDEDDDI